MTRDEATVGCGPRWGVILAGGEGSRLRPLTAAIAGDERPKQFCALLGTETLLEQTWQRATLAIDSQRMTVVVTRAHERHYAPILARARCRGPVIQPENRGTAPAILYALRTIAARAPTGAVAVLPSDHYVSDDAAFMDHVAAAFAAVERRPELVILLGITPESPEVEYGWIEPGDAIASSGLRRVRRYWEKPTAALAASLLVRGGLWNSFVMVAGIPALLSVIRAALPELDAAFAAVARALGTPAEDDAVRALYSRLGTTSFSERILTARLANLAVLPVTGVQWSDWGRPRRVLETLARLGIQPQWAGRVARLA